MCVANFAMNGPRDVRDDFGSATTEGTLSVRNKHRENLRVDHDPMIRPDIVQIWRECLWPVAKMMHIAESRTRLVEQAVSGGVLL